MNSSLEFRNSLWRWGIAAFCTVILLAVMLIYSGYRNSSVRWSSFLVGDPHVGALLFFEKKGCVGCHPVNGMGGKSAPDLGFSRSPQSGISQIVSAMWNHAPTMLESMRAKGVRYPDLDHEDVANLFAFLYTARYVDEPGDETRGERLFATKGCARCHPRPATEAAIGPDLSTVKGVDTPIVWAQTM
jgi:cytochrome c peroxidase